MSAVPIPIALAGLRGLRSASLSESDLADAVQGHEVLRHGAPGEVLKRDSRSLVTGSLAGSTRVIVKEVRKGGGRRRLADAFRGSAARRGWNAGRELRASGLGAAAPLAFLEQRRLAVPVRSLLVMEDLRPAPTALALAQRGAGDAARAIALLTDLATDLHRNGFLHGDLRAQHVYVLSEGERQTAALIDYGDLHRRRTLSDGARIRELVQLNASLPDELAPAESRRAALHRYAAALPFARTEENVLAEIVLRSIARRDRWRGSDCARAAHASRGDGVSPNGP